MLTSNALNILVPRQLGLVTDSLVGTNGEFLFELEGGYSSLTRCKVASHGLKFLSMLRSPLRILALAWAGYNSGFGNHCSSTPMMH